MGITKLLLFLQLDIVIWIMQVQESFLFVDGGELFDTALLENNYKVIKFLRLIFLWY